jgi:hypothetical protein
MDERREDLSVVAAVGERVRLGVLERQLHQDLQRHPWLPTAALMAMFDQWAAQVRNRWPLPASLERAARAAARRVALSPQPAGPCTDPAGCVLCVLAGGRPDDGPDDGW